MRRNLMVWALVAAFVWTLGGVGDLYAGWDDRSDELPGMDDSGTETVLVIGGLVLAGVLVYYLVKKSGDDGQAGLDTPSTLSVAGGSSGPLEFLSPDRSIEQARECSVKIDPLFLVQKHGVGAGLSITF